MKPNIIKGMKGTVNEFSATFTKEALEADNNPFTPFTDKLAKTLLEKNKAYGDSFLLSR